MLLSQLIGKHVYCGSCRRGIVLGVGVNVKNGAVKYLLCAKDEKLSLKSKQTDFAIALTTVLSIGTDIVLSKLRTLYPKACAKLFLHSPAYTNNGVYLGMVEDGEMEYFTMQNLLLDDNTVYPFTAVTAISDALIFKKVPPYPIGQRIPAPTLAQIGMQNVTSVSRALLKKSIEKGQLISLTLSLEPFRL